MALGAEIEVGLNAAIVAVRETTPLILVVEDANAPDLLPSGPFDPISHRTMEMGLRNWVTSQTGLDLGYVEQLYTFGDRGRHPQPGDQGPFAVSVGYLALTQTALAGPGDNEISAAPARWRSWYTYFPWEDWRIGRPPILDAVITPALLAWAAAGDDEKLSSPQPRRPGAGMVRARGVGLGRGAGA